MVAPDSRPCGHDGMGTDPFDSGKPIPYTAAVASDAVQRQDGRLTAVCHFVVSGDGNERLPRLTPEEIGYPEVTVVTSVELLRYIEREYPGKFNLGVAFNPYEPEQHEFEKMERKIDAGAKYIITQPLIGRNPITDRMIEQFQLPVIVEAWMSRKLHLLSECVGYEIPEDTEYDPIAALKDLHVQYPNCGVYLAILGYKTQFPLLEDMWT